MKRTKLWIFLFGALATVATASAQDTFADDVFIQKNLCAGSSSCASGGVLPVSEIHVLSNDPQVRFEDAEFGQKWEIFADATGFDIVDVNALTFPLTIDPGAPDFSFSVGSDGNLGSGVEVPLSSMHVRRSDGTAKILVEETASTAARRLFELRNSGLTGFRINNTAGPFPWDFFATVQSFEIAEVGDGDGAEMRLLNNGNLEILGSLISGGPSCGGGCDAVFSSAIESIDEHAAAMWTQGYLPGIGPTAAHEPMNVSEKIGGLLNELEKAHIYIDELHGRLEEQEQRKEEEIADLEARIRRLEALVEASLR